MTAMQVPGLLTFTIAILVFFRGVGLNRLIRPLQRWNIPEAVTGGLLAAVVTLLANTVFGVEISFSLDARDARRRAAWGRTSDLGRATVSHSGTLTWPTESETDERKDFLQSASKRGSSR
jgi:hypothetical protein